MVGTVPLNTQWSIELAMFVGKLWVRNGQIDWLATVEHAIVNVFDHFGRQHLGTQRPSWLTVLVGKA